MLLFLKYSCCQFFYKQGRCKIQNVAVGKMLAVAHNSRCHLKIFLAIIHAKNMNIKGNGFQ
jgi:hypothetical protein